MLGALVLKQLPMPACTGEGPLCHWHVELGSDSLLVSITLDYKESD